MQTPYGGSSSVGTAYCEQDGRSRSQRFWHALCVLSVGAFMIAVFGFFLWIDARTNKDNIVRRYSAPTVAFRCYQNSLEAVGSVIDRPDATSVRLAFASGTIETYPLEAVQGVTCPKTKG